jgi:hypothetical protein
VKLIPRVKVTVARAVTAARAVVKVNRAVAVRAVRIALILIDLLLYGEIQ